MHWVSLLVRLQVSLALCNCSSSESHARLPNGLAFCYSHAMLPSHFEFSMHDLILHFPTSIAFNTGFERFSSSSTKFLFPFLLRVFLRDRDGIKGWARSFHGKAWEVPVLSRLTREDHPQKNEEQSSRWPPTRRHCRAIIIVLNLMTDIVAGTVDSFRWPSRVTTKVLLWHTHNWIRNHRVWNLFIAL